jgi:cytochrome P450
MSQLHSPVVCIVDLPRGLEFLERNRESLQQSALPFARLIPGSYIEFMNGEHHERFRGILRPALLGPAVTACRPYVAEVVCAALAEMASRGGDRGVEPGEFFDRIALDSLLCIFFGVRRGDDRFKRFRSLYALIDFRRGFYTRAPRALTEGFERAVSEVRAIIEETRVDPPDEANSSVLTEVLRANAAAGDDETLTTVIGNLVFLVAVARDDLQGFLMWVFKMCCDHPQYAMRLRDGDADEQRLSMHIVKETLRLRQSEYVYRDLIEDCRFGDYRIPKGWRIRLCLAESHRLASVFPEPEQFDPQRFADRSYSKTEYCPFSDGDHACFGTRVVMVVSQTFLFELASGFDWQIVADGPVERGNRQWHHWKPSSRLRVAMKLRTT